MTKKGEERKQTTELAMTNGIKAPTVESLSIDVIKKYFCPQATTKELELALNVCKVNNLNPFKREAHIVKKGEDQPITVMTGYEVYLKRAERSGKYAGFKVWTEGEIPNMKACINVYRKDWTEPLYHEVEYQEYVQVKFDRRKNTYVPNRQWSKRPKTMLKKVVISQAFRLAWPDEFDGMPYIHEEYDPSMDLSNDIDHETETMMPKRISDNAQERTNESQSTDDSNDSEGNLGPAPEEPPADTRPSKKWTGSEAAKKLKELKDAVGEDDFWTVLKNIGITDKKQITLSRMNEIVDAIEPLVSVNEDFGGTDEQEAI